MLGDQLMPHRHRHVVSIFAIPGHLLDRESALGLDEDGPAEEKLKGQCAVAERMQVLGGGHLEVVCAVQRQGDSRVAGESGDHRGAVLPQEGALGDSPAFAGTEKVHQSVRLGIGIGTTQRLDSDLAAQRNGVHRVFAAGVDPDAGGQHRADGVGFGRHVQHGEGQVQRLFVHRGVSTALPATFAKKLSMNSRAC